MFTDTLDDLHCPHCKADLKPPKSSNHDLWGGEVTCTHCPARYPILAGVLILVKDVNGYLAAHAKGVSRFVPQQDIPKTYKKDYLEALEGLEAEHIEEDLEAERVTALYVMTHYLDHTQVRSPSATLQKIIDQYWDHGPFARIQESMKALKPRSFVELGCGVGGLSLKLGDSVDRYLGLDSSFASLVLARHLTLGQPISKPILFPDDLLEGPATKSITIKKPRALPAKLDFVACDLEDPPLKQGRWSASAALNVIDMLEEPAALPKLQYDLLEKGGVAIQSCPYIWHPVVAFKLRKAVKKELKTSNAAVESLYERSGFKIETSLEHLPWVFFKNARQLELYSVHLFHARK